MLDLRAQIFEALGLEKGFTELRRGFRVYKHISIVDLKNLKMSHFSKDVRNVIKSIISLGSIYYPESLWKLYLINAPTVFRAIWAVVKPMVHPETLAKTFILGGKSDYLPVLQREGLPAESIPLQLGGTHPGVSASRLCDDAIAFATAAAARYPAVPPRERLRVAVANLSPATRTLAAAAVELRVAAAAGPASEWVTPPPCPMPELPPHATPAATGSGGRPVVGGVGGSGHGHAHGSGSGRRSSFEVPGFAELRAVRLPDDDDAVCMHVWVLTWHVCVVVPSFVPILSARRPSLALGRPPPPARRAPWTATRTRRRR
jgi:hypothetical protein